MQTQVTQVVQIDRMESAKLKIQSTQYIVQCRKYTMQRTKYTGKAKVKHPYVHMYACFIVYACMYEVWGLLADALVLGNHVLLGLLPLVPVVQHDLLALGDHALQLLVIELVVVVLDPGGEVVPVRVQVQDHVVGGDVDLLSAGTLPHLQQLVVLVPQGTVQLGLQVGLPVLHDT